MVNGERRTANSQQLCWGRQQSCNVAGLIRRSFKCNFAFTLRRVLSHFVHDVTDHQSYHRSTGCEGCFQCATWSPHFTRSSYQLVFSYFIRHYRPLRFPHPCSHLFRFSLSFDRLSVAGGQGLPRYTALILDCHCRVI